MNDASRRGGRAVCVLLAVVASGVTWAQGATSTAASPLPGLWRALDERSGEPLALVRMYEAQGRFYGRIERALTPLGESARCTRCRDERQNQPINGLIVIRNLRPLGKAWGDGDILDPQTGLAYRCRVQIADDGRQLRVEGFIRFPWLGRTQTWIREP